MGVYYSCRGPIRVARTPLSQRIFLVSTAEVFTLYKRMCPLWECFGSSWGELGEWVGSDVLGSSWGVGWEH